jgi:hypothetical protein
MCWLGSGCGGFREAEGEQIVDTGAFSTLRQLREAWRNHANGSTREARQVSTKP